MVDGEKAVKPASAFRLQGSRTDYSFLLQLIEEVSGSGAVSQDCGRWTFRRAYVYE